MSAIDLTTIPPQLDTFRRRALAVGAVAAAEGMLEETARYCKEREAFGAPIAKLQNTRFKLAEMAGVTGTEAPESMEKVNMLLEVLPYDVSEFMLTEYLNNMMVADRE